MKTVEELLTPRYEVIADYPHNPWLVGMALTVEPDGELYNAENGYVDYVSIVREKNVGKYPHIFKKLEWWEERDKSDLPEYIRITDEGVVVKVERHSQDIGFSFNGRRKVYSNNTTPATEEEYLNQQSDADQS